MNHVPTYRRSRWALLGAALAVTLALAGFAGVATPSAEAFPKNNYAGSGAGCWYGSLYKAEGERVYVGGKVYECRNGLWTYVGVLALVPAASATVVR